jgi:ABC-type lipoprotein release transport system permease subunit
LAAGAEWRRRWPSLIAIALLVALVGGVVTALAAGARRVDSAYDRFREARHVANLTASVELDEEQLPDDRVAETVDALAAIDGVEGVSVDSWWAIADLPDLEARPGAVTAFVAAPLAVRGTINEPIVLEGALPTAGDSETVVINQRAAELADLHVGDVLTMRTASPARLAEWAANDGQFESDEALDGPVVDVRVAAIARSDEDLGEQPFPLVSVSPQFTAAHADEIAHLVPSVSLRADPDDLERVAAEAAAILAPYGMEVRGASSVGETIRPSTRVETATLWVAAAVAAAAGVLLVIQAVGRHLGGAASDHPTMRALGMTTRQLTLGGVLAVLPAIAAGVVLVPLVAWILSGLFPRGVARAAEPDPGPRIDGWAFAIGLLATTIVLVLATVLIARNAARAPRVDAVGRSHLAGWVIGRPAASLGASFAGDPAGTGRPSRAQAVATVLGVALGVGGVIGIAALDASRQHLDASPRLYGAPTDLVFVSNGTFGMDALAQQVLATEGVTALTRAIAINDFTLTATGPGGSAGVEPSAYVIERGDAVPPVAEGDYPAAPGQVGLGRAVADALGADVGDRVSVPVLGEGTRVELQVSGIVVAWDEEDPSHGFVTTPETLRQILCPTATPQECDVSTNLFASVADADGRAALSELSFMDAVPPATVLRLQEVGPIPWLLAAFLCLLGVAGLAHAVVTAQRRRCRDVAIVRALGLRVRAASSALTWQAALLATGGAIVGLVLGVVVGRVLWRLLADDLGVIVVAESPTWVIVLAIVGALVTAVVVSLAPRWRTSHHSAAEGLRAE